MKAHIASSNAWSDGNQYIMGTASEVHTNALFDIYPNDTSITAEIKGNTQQNGTPSPSAPVPVVGVGYLDGAAYKMPINIGLSTQSIDLSMVTSVRYILKKVLDGTETTWTSGTTQGRMAFYWKTGTQNPTGAYVLCTHYKAEYVVREGVCFTTSNNVAFIDSSFQSLDDFKAFIADEYAANHPVTIWYVQNTATTGIVNEPLQKIGTYADSISNISLTTTAGAKSFSVETALKPSEITLNFRGWHPKDPHERTGGEWS